MTRRGRATRKTLFVALYPGRCDADGCRIAVGDQIGYAEGYDKPLCHPCWEQAYSGVTAEPAPPCPACFLIHAGECP